MTRDILKSAYAQAAIVFAVALIAYANSIGNGFVYDDKTMVTDNPWIKDLSYIPMVFTTNIWAYSGEEVTNFYRPIPLIILMINYQLFGVEPLGYHLSYVLLNGAVSVLMYFFFRRLFAPVTGVEGGYLALAGALLFATHPTHTEVVAWNGAHEMVFTAFAVICVLLHMRGRYGLVVIPFLAAAFTKETAAIIPLILIAYDLSFDEQIRSRSAKEALKVLIPRYAPIFVAGVAYIAIRTYAIGGFAPVNNYPELTPYLIGLNATVLFTDYIMKLALPVSLLANKIFTPELSALTPGVIFSITATAGFIAALVLTRKRLPLAFFSLSLVCLPLLPVMHIPALGYSVFAERYLYLPSAGFIIIMVMCVSVLATALTVNAQKAAAVFFAVTLTTTAVYSAVTINRNPVWKDDLALWTDTVAKDPDNFLARNNLGVTYREFGRFKEARGEFESAIAIKPDYALAHFNLALTYYKLGDKERAINEYVASLMQDPGYVEAAFNLALVYHETNRPELAEAVYKEIISNTPDNDRAYNNLGLLYFESGRSAEAVNQYKLAIKINPKNALFRSNLGSAYGALGRLDEAVGELKRAVELDRSLKDAAINLTVAYVMKDMEDEARSVARDYIQTNPQDVETKSLLDSVISGSGAAR